MHGHITGTRILQVPSHRPLKQSLELSINPYFILLHRVDLQVEKIILLNESTLRYESPSSNPYQNYLLNYYSVIIKFIINYYLNCH